MQCPKCRSQITSLKCEGCGFNFMESMLLSVVKIDEETLLTIRELYKREEKRDLNEQRRRGREQEAQKRYKAAEQERVRVTEHNRKRREEEERIRTSKMMKASENNACSKDIVRPNDPCPCGSGKKYKMCHGK